ncbi:MAG: heavy-metal-associated domain-containing protein [Planctomycetota bacterium]|jgi:copper chaperone CopZ
MKHLGLLFCIIPILYVQGCGQPEQNEATVLLQDSNARVYEVFGMDCPGCHGGLEKLVKKVPGVKEAQANWQKQRLIVIVEPNAEVEDEAIYDAIRRANFTPGKKLQ